MIEAARISELSRDTCRIHCINSDIPDTDRAFLRVPCLGEDILIEGSPDTWRVVGVVWALDRPLLELSKVAR